MSRVMRRSIPGCAMSSRRMPVWRPRATGVSPRRGDPSLRRWTRTISGIRPRSSASWSASAPREPATALVYAWCYWVAEDGLTLGYAPPLRHEGNVFPQMCLGNLVVSASNALVRREALLAAGGFDEKLRSAGGQGCEDWKLYLQIAERHEIAGVPEYLVGYRIRPGAMSDDFAQMMRSRRLVEEQFLPRHPDLAANFATGRAILARSLAMRAFRRGRYGMALQLLAGYPDRSLRVMWRSAGWLVQGVGRRIARSLSARNADHRSAPVDGSSGRARRSEAQAATYSPGRSWRPGHRSSALSPSPTAPPGSGGAWSSGVPILRSGGGHYISGS